MSTSEKLKDNEKSLFRRVYLARIEAGASVEAAEKQALHAVKRWDALGALNDDRPDPRDVGFERLRKMNTKTETPVVETADTSIGFVGVAALRTLALWFESSDKEPTFGGRPMSDLILNVVRGTMPVDEFVNLLH